jgi:hypothetical protein
VGGAFDQCAERASGRARPRRAGPAIAIRRASRRSRRSGRRSSLPGSPAGRPRPRRLAPPSRGPRRGRRRAGREGRIWLRRPHRHGRRGGVFPHNPSAARRHCR